MTWREASEDAQLWIDRKQLKNADIIGKRLDLVELFKGHPVTVPGDKMIIYEAATRILRKRGSNTNLYELDPATALPRSAAQ